MTRWKLKIEYDGRPYSGFQRQPDVKTVQGEIEKALYKFCQQEIQITVAGRTDAGVHATGQIAHLDLDYRHSDGSERELSGFDLAKAINAHLGDELISIIDAEEVDPGFHARFDATNKLYTYRIVNRPYGLALDHGHAWWFKKPLDIGAMNEAAQHLIGHHDFSTFRDSQCQANSPIRTLDLLKVEERQFLGQTEILIHAEGRSFLHHQVRNMVGTLSLVGEGKWNPEDVRVALQKCDRTAGGPTAPADGLYLVRIDYP